VYLISWAAPKCSSMKLDIKLHCETFFGQNVFIVGDHPQLGEWDPRNGIRMHCQSPSKWRLSFDIHNESKVLKYKYCILNDLQDAGGIPFWEPGKDRELNWASCNGEVEQISDTWGTEDKVIEIIKGVFPGRLYCSPMPFSTLFDPKGSIYSQYKQLNLDCIILLAYREECLDKTNGIDLTVRYGKDTYPVIYYPIDDFGVPEKQSFIKLVDRLKKSLEKGDNVIIHSHAGIGRTGVLLTCLLRRCLSAGKLQGVLKIGNIDDIMKYVKSQVRGTLQAENQIKFVKELDL